MSTVHPHLRVREDVSDTAFGDAVLRVEGLSIGFALRSRLVHAVDEVSLCVPRGKVVALVGESGCGKSLTALSILRLLSPPAQITSGQTFFCDAKAAVEDTRKSPAMGQGPLYPRDSPGLAAPIDLLQADPPVLRHIRGNRIAMVFQEPMTSLNPVLSVGEQISEAIQLHSRARRREAWDRALELLCRVEIADAARRAREYPHQFSGGMRQRVMIAMAIANGPALLIADEPTTALDVTTQRQILDLLAGLQQENGMSVLLITHDLGVVAEWSDWVYVMYAGRIVEHASTDELLRNPLHPYTQGLVECTPRLGRGEARLPTIAGLVPEPACYPAGCRFHPRCAVAAERAREAGRISLELASGQRVLRRCAESCLEEPSGVPGLRTARDGHFVACWEAACSTAGA